MRLLSDARPISRLLLAVAMMGAFAASSRSTPALNEFGCGPVCDRMSEGFIDETGQLPSTKHLALTGGFLGVDIRREAGNVLLRLQHHDSHSKVAYTHVVTAPSS